MTVEPKKIADELVISTNQQLLNSIADGDYVTYSHLCAKDLTCFEPESAGMLMHGLDFHKYYFDLGNQSRPPADPSKKSFYKINMSNPHIRRLGENALVVSYIRVDQYLDEKNQAATKTMSETRIWEIRNGCLVHVHFHKS